MQHAVTPNKVTHPISDFPAWKIFLEMELPHSRFICQKALFFPLKRGIIFIKKERDPVGRGAAMAFVDWISMKELC
jgi:hypothetical protein